MKNVRSSLYKILSRCKGGPHEKTNKAERKKNKQNLKKMLTESF
jgi:hypothetical protein